MRESRYVVVAGPREQTDGHAGQYYITTAYQSPARWDLGLRGRISN